MTDSDGSHANAGNPGPPNQPNQPDTPDSEATKPDSAAGRVKGYGFNSVRQQPNEPTLREVITSDPNFRTSIQRHDEPDEAAQQAPPMMVPNLKSAGAQPGVPPLSKTLQSAPQKAAKSEAPDLPLKAAAAPIDSGANDPLAPQAAVARPSPQPPAQKTSKSETKPVVTKTPLTKSIEAKAPEAKESEPKTPEVRTAEVEVAKAAEPAEPADATAPAIKSSGSEKLIVSAEGSQAADQEPPKPATPLAAKPQVSQPLPVPEPPQQMEAADATEAKSSSAGSERSFGRRSVLSTSDQNNGDSMPARSSDRTFNPMILAGGAVGWFQSSGRRGLGMGLAVVGILGSAIATWVAYQSGQDDPYGAGVPVVEAGDLVTKQRPDDEGGLAIPDRDKLVFENLGSGAAEPGVEHLLPPPEQPVAIGPATGGASPQILSGEPALNPPMPAPPATVADAQTAAGLANDATPQPQAPSSPASSDAQVQVPPPAVAQPVPTDQVAARPPEPASPPPTAAVGNAADGYRIQLASLRQRDDIQGAWQRLQGRHAGVLGALALHVQEARLDSGTFYRIQAGPLSSRAAADAACQALTTNDQACLVVAP